MKSKIFIGLFLSIFGLTFLAVGGALAAKKSRVPLVLPVDGAQPPEAYHGAPSPVMYEGGMQPDCEDIHPAMGYSYVIQHDQFGATWYDYQKNGSVGRMIAVGPGGHAHETYHRTDGPYSVTYPRYVDYNCKDPVMGWIGAAAIDGGTNVNAGYCNIGVLHDGRCVVIYHTYAASVLRIQDAVCTQDWTYRYDLPDYMSGGDDPGMWPKLGIVYDDSVDTDYIHVVQTEGKTSGGNQRLGYLRCRLLPNDHLLCDTPDNGAQGVVTPIDITPNTTGCGSSCPIAYFGECEAPGVPVGKFPNCISVIVATSPVSQKVAIVFTNKREAGDIQVNNDVFYFESDSNGMEWFPQFGGTWPPTVANGMLTCVTNYPTDFTERAYTDVAACYDYNDHLHIVWNSCYYDSATGDIDFNANLIHWTDTDPPGIANASIIAPGYWDDGTISCGGWNRILSKMSISAQDPIYHPGGDPDSVFLFCTWTQFNLGDNSLADYTNGDIYAAVSSDGGQTWTPGYNLTNTKTPNCTSDVCLSEHWSSLAENIYDGELYIQYVCDRDPGFAGREGADWTENHMMYLHLEQLPETTVCGAAIKLMDPTDWCYPPLKVVPGEDRIITMELTGLGTIGGNYEVTTDNPNIVATANGSGFLMPQEERTVEITINCQEEGFLSAQVYVNYCIGSPNWEDEKIDTTVLHVVQSEDYYECPRDSATWIEKDNCTLKGKFWVNCEERVWDKRVLDPEGDTIQPIFSASPIVATSYQGDTIVGRQDWGDVLTGARDVIHYVMGQDPNQPECGIQVVWNKNTFICGWPLEIPNHHRWWWIDIHKQIFMWHDHPGFECPEWKKEQIIKQIRTTKSLPPLWWPEEGVGAQGYEDIWFGYMADVDAPFDTGCLGCNIVGFDETNWIAWAQGYNAESHPEYEDYFAGLAFSDCDGNIVAPMGIQKVFNDSFLYPQDGWGWIDEELYEFAASLGVSNPYPDSVADYSFVMTADKIDGGTADFFGEYILIEAFVPTGGLPALQAHVADTRAQLIPHLRDMGLLDECPNTICGDANEDGIINAADVVFLINYLYVPGSPAPSWPITRGDVNSDGVVDSADLVYLINYLFVPDSPPPECPGFGK